jgi:IMP cyclohydrolase
MSKEDWAVPWLVHRAEVEYGLDFKETPKIEELTAEEARFLSKIESDEVSALHSIYKSIRSKAKEKQTAIYYRISKSLGNRIISQLQQKGYCVEIEKFTDLETTLYISWRQL